MTLCFLVARRSLRQKKSNIYPQELRPNRENNLNQKASFLDIDNEIFDKQKDLNFQITDYSYLNGKCP